MKKLNLSNFGFNILQIETKAACNMACSFCPYPLKDDKTSTLDFESIKRILNQVNPKDPKFKYLTFSQFNEPLLDNRIFEIVQYAKNLGFKIYFVTNGLLLNKSKNVEELIKSKPEIKISLQIIEQGKHQEGRGLNLDLIRYSKTIFDFCNKVKNTDLKVDIDIGCNFNDNKFKYFLKRFFGLQAGDPSIIDNRKKTLKILKDFLEEMSKINENANEMKETFFGLLDQNILIKKNAQMSDYIFQEGIDLASNIKLKIKPFFYGRRIEKFYPISDNFSCESEILGILSDGSVVPCCLAYDDTISLGNVNNKSNLEEVLNSGKTFLDNLRTKNSSKHDTCKKCFGEPTHRGVIFRNIYNYLKGTLKLSG